MGIMNLSILQLALLPLPTHTQLILSCIRPCLPFFGAVTVRKSSIITDGWYDETDETDNIGEYAHKILPLKVAWFYWSHVLGLRVTLSYHLPVFKAMFLVAKCQNS